MDLYGLKEDSMEVGALGASALVGAAIAKQVVGIDALNSLPAAKWLKPLIPVAVGVAVHSYGKSRFPVAAPGVAAGMVAFGVASLVKAAVAGTAADSQVTGYLPFNGLGFTYDSGIMGLGFDRSGYGAGVDAYMGISGSPVQVVATHGLGSGAPVQIQTVTGRSVAMNGLGSTIVGSSAPLSTSLYA